MMAAVSGAKPRKASAKTGPNRKQETLIAPMIGSLLTTRSKAPPMPTIKTAFHQDTEK